MENAPHDSYRRYCRPKMGNILKSIRLDKTYHRAAGDYIYFHDESGKEVEILDFLGGYGASLFGHNNPDLLGVARSNFDNMIPFNSQASIRGGAAALGKKLNDMLFARTGRNFVTTLASTGTEAAEAAIKHAEMVQYNRIRSMLAELKKKIIYLKQQHRNGLITVSPYFSSRVEELLGVAADADFCDKLAAMYEHNQALLKTEPYFLALEKSFHGKSTGSVKLTYNEEYRAPFSRIGIRVLYVEAGNLKELQDAVDRARFTCFLPELKENGEVIFTESEFTNISAFFIEPLQGEGGIIKIDPVFLAACRVCADRYNFPLVFDEIQCGMGRTGTFLFSEQLGVTADYYLLSKSLGGGLAKISAMMVREDLYEEDFGFIHSSTFAEDDHSSNIALAALELLERDPALMQNCRERGEQLLRGLHALMEAYPTVLGEIKGAGLMLGVSFRTQRNFGSFGYEMLTRQRLLGFMIAGYLLHEHGIRVAPTMSNTATIRLEPSAFVKPEECERLLSAMARLCEIIYKQNIYELTKYLVGAETPGANAAVANFREEREPYRKPRFARSVAIVTHIIDIDHLDLFDRGFALFTRKQKEAFIESVWELISPQVYDQMTVTSATGESIHANHVAVFVDSMTIARHMFQRNLKPIHDKIEEALEVSIEHGCQAITFGGFTSIVTKNCETLASDSIVMTTGNSLTVAMGLEAIYRAAQDNGIDVAESTFAAIGAAGNICSIYCEMIAERVPRLILIGKAGKGNDERLNGLAARIYENAFREIALNRLHKSGEGELSGVALAIAGTGTVRELLERQPAAAVPGLLLFERLNLELGERAPIMIGDDYSLIRNANLIVGASNAPGAVIFPEMLGEGRIVICDIAVPNDVHPSVHEKRKDVFVMQGGIVKLPFNPEFRISGMPLNPGLLYACQAEGILLGLTKVGEHFSHGRINKGQVKKIMDICHTHGFDLGNYKTERSF